MVNRYIFLDALKGLAIMLVVLFHAVAWNDPDNGNNYFLNFWMPILMPTFFGIGGYLLYKSRVDHAGKWILDKARYLLVPHFLINVLMFLATFTGAPTGSEAINSLGFGEWMRQTLIFDKGEWFCWTYFFVLLLALRLKRVDAKSSERRFWTYLVISTALIMLMPLPAGFLHLAHIQWYYPVTVIGYLMAKYWPALAARAFLKWIVLAGALMYVPYLFLTDWVGAFVTRPSLNNFIWIVLGTPLEGPKVLLQSLLGCCLFTSLVYLLGKVRGLMSLLAVFGQRSFGIYFFQQFLLVAITLGAGGLRQTGTFIIVLSLSLILSIALGYVPSLNKWFPSIKYQLRRVNVH